MKLLFFLTIFGVFLMGVNSLRIVRQLDLASETGGQQNEMSESEKEPQEMEESENEPQEMEESENEPQEMEESSENEPQEMEESESEVVSETVQPSEIQEVEATEEPEPTEPTEMEIMSEVGAILSSVTNVPSENTGGQPADIGENSSEEAMQSAAINQNGAELAGGDSSQEVVDGSVNSIYGGAGLDLASMNSEEVNVIGSNAVGTEPIPTQLIATTPFYEMPTGNLIGEMTTAVENRGDAFFADFGPQEGAQNPDDTESSTSSQKIGVIVGATTAGTVAVAAGLAIGYVKLKGASAAGAGAA